MFWLVLLGSWLWPQIAMSSGQPSTQPVVKAKRVFQKPQKHPSSEQNQRAAAPTSLPTKQVSIAKNPKQTKPPVLLGKKMRFRKHPTGKGARPKKTPPVFSSILTQRSFFWSQLLGMLVALFIVLLLLYGFLRWMAERMGVTTTNNNKLLRVCDRLSLEAKKGLWIVEAGGQYLLIATHEQGVTLLERLDAQSINEKQQNKQETPGFWERLRRPSIDEDAMIVQASDPLEKINQESKSDVIPTQFEVVSDGKPTSNSTT